MISKYLFPHRVKKIGLFLMIFGFMVGFPILLIYFFGSAELQSSLLEFLHNTFGLTYKKGFFGNGLMDYFFDEVTSVSFIIGAILYGFSKEQNEDEFISKIRSESLMIATYVNFGILILAIIGIYEMNFFKVITFNMFTLLIIFILRYKYVLYRHEISLSDEE